MGLYHSYPFQNLHINKQDLWFITIQNQSLVVMVDEDLGDALKKVQEDKKKEAIEWKNKGNDSFKKGDYENAIQNFKNALDVDPNYSDAWNNLGLAYIKIGKIDDAKKCQESMRLLKPSKMLPL